MKFSIILPAYIWNEYRKNTLERAVKSVENQTFKDFELVLVNDGSIAEFKVPSWVRVITKKNEERIIAYNAGIKEAKGDIFCFLDSDDEYEPDYLQKVASYYRKYPKYQMFNFGCRFIHVDGKETNREAFKPKKERIGHEVFGGGTIVNGTFVFDREVYESLGAFPEAIVNYKNLKQINYREGPLFMHTPYDFSAAAQMEFPEIRKYFMVHFENEPKKILKELGNPWGNDYYLFYKYTRLYHSKPIDDYLYIVHLKEGVK